MARQQTHESLNGGCTVSIFDAETGTLRGDTANQLDAMTYSQPVYPEQRNANKGSEPERVVALDLEGETCVAVGMERAGAVALISLTDPSHPEVVSLAKLTGEEKNSPEGIAHFMLHGEPYLLVADEMNGTVECFNVLRNNRAAETR